MYLAEHNTNEALARVKTALRGFIDAHGISPSKYHDTMTQAWMLAVRHFMQRSESAASADAFIDANPRLLDSKIMLSHYSADLLFSPQAREQFVEPDLSGFD